MLCFLSERHIRSTPFTNFAKMSHFEYFSMIILDTSIYSVQPSTLVMVVTLRLRPHCVIVLAVVSLVESGRFWGKLVNLLLLIRAPTM